ncbi:MAG: methyltransferase domain-containing protein [Chloroflexota bacterium]|nr:methyltransferase domain-containing protein [Chloroflexota bacterium]
MSLYSLDTVHNAHPDPSIEALLEVVREEVARFPFTPDRDAGSSQEVLEAFDQARPRLNVIASLLRDVEGCGADISTGIGFLPLVVRRLGLQIVATEADPESARFALAHGISVQPWTIGREQPPIAPESLVFLVFGEVLEHLKLSPIPILEQLARLLRPGGRLILTTPNIARQSNVEALVAGENFLEPFPDDLPLDIDATDFLEHVREYSVREVVDAVEAAGFGIDEVLMTGWGAQGYQPRVNPYSNDIMVVVATA